MKRKLFILLFAICSTIIFGQARLGSTVSDIKSEFSESSYNLKSGYDSDDDYYIILTTEKAEVLHYFNSDKICNLSIIKPKNQGALNYYVELYNKQYVIISDRKWKMYSENGIANIELLFPESGKYLFRWSD
jgi:hypothetical protein